MSKKVVLFLTLLVYIYSSIFCLAEQLETERQTKAIPPSLPAATEETEKDKIFGFVFYETSDVTIGRNRGEWSEKTGSAGYIHKGISIYAAYSQLERLHDIDNTYNLGSYFKIKDFYLHEEIGFGTDISYIYKFQNIAEISHKLYKSLFWQLGYTYRNYLTNDSHLVSPGLTYYIGDSYITAMYGFSHIVTRGTTGLITLKGAWVINDRLQWNAGATYGGWLYDIYGLDDSDEMGYILSTGVKVRVYKDFNIGAGYSYGTEEPRFFIHSVDIFASVKF